MINPIDYVFEYLDQKQAIATLTAERDAARAERDAAILRAAEAEANYKFHLGLTCEADERRKAQVTR